MTDIERQYLRSAFLHYNETLRKTTQLSTDAKKLADFVHAAVVLKDIVNIVLQIEGDYDGFTIEALEEIFVDNNIERISQ